MSNSKKINNKIFVYGTLKVGGFFAQNFDQVRRSSQKASIKGTMFSVHDSYPAVVLEGDMDIQGEVHEYDDINAVLQQLDHIEGCVGEGAYCHNLYNRFIVNVQTTDGNTVEAWMYTFNQSTDGLREVENGSWAI